jgi:predicted nucleotidyltransferase
MHLSSSGFGDSDIDVFFYGLTPKEARHKLRGLLRQLAANAARQRDGAILHGYCSSDEDVFSDDSHCCDGGFEEEEEEEDAYDEHVSCWAC